MDLQLKVGGWWLSSVAAWGGLEYSHRHPGGPWEASWQMSGISPDFHHPALTRGADVEIFYGPKRIWKGELDEPDLESWRCTAIGLAQTANRYLCLDAVGNTTSIPNTAIDQAIARGLRWTRLADFSSTAWAGASETESLNYLDTLLDAQTESTSNRWSVNDDGIITKSSDPTTPTWQMTPLAAKLGVAGDDYASTAFGRYKDSTSHDYATVTAVDSYAEARWGAREVGIDLTVLGEIPASRAQSVVDRKLSKGAARPGWTNDLEPTAFTMTNMGGVPAVLPLARAGQMVRLHGVLDPRSVACRLDVVIAESTYNADSDRLVLRPMGRKDRTLADALAVQPNPKFKG